MKNQQFTTLDKEFTLQILGGITDPNLDPDAGYVEPADDPVSTDDPVDTTPVDTAPGPRRSR
ncbi:hypothetical protein [uncultured Kordia sp.]|uniref:hypothetical protein n=1 Tax=uncultured Kordia sp. TaxID=507699 RepID=UPI002636D585|nr:hypothetical protein [uncultured Kordia sp.]